MKNFSMKARGASNRGGGFTRGNSTGSKPPFEKKTWGGNRGNGGETVMHKATCSNCKNACEVPFRPTNGKPVFCRDCFGDKKESDTRGARKDFGNRGDNRSFGDNRDNRGASRGDFARPAFTPHVAREDNSKQLAEINSKLDRMINVMERMLKTTDVPKVSPEIENHLETTDIKAPKTSKKKITKIKK